MNFGRDYLGPPFRAKLGIPIPMELFWVILMIIFSITFNIKDNFNVAIVNHIHTGYGLFK